MGNQYDKSEEEWYRIRDSWISALDKLLEELRVYEEQYGAELYAVQNNGASLQETIQVCQEKREDLLGMKETFHSREDRLRAFFHLERLVEIQGACYKIIYPEYLYWRDHFPILKMTIAGRSEAARAEVAKKAMQHYLKINLTIDRKSEEGKFFYHFIWNDKMSSYETAMNMTWEELEDCVQLSYPGSSIIGEIRENVADAAAKTFDLRQASASSICDKYWTLSYAMMMNERLYEDEHFECNSDEFKQFKILTEGSCAGKLRNNLIQFCLCLAATDGLLARSERKVIGDIMNEYLPQEALASLIQDLKLQANDRSDILMQDASDIFKIAIHLDKWLKANGKKPHLAADTQQLFLMTGLCVIKSDGIVTPDEVSRLKHSCQELVTVAQSAMA